MQVADVIAACWVRSPDPGQGYDGSTAGPDTPRSALRIASPRALARLVTAPGTLGLARAYVTGELEVEGDLYAAARRRSTTSRWTRCPAPSSSGWLASSLPMRLRHRVRPPRSWSTARRAGCTRRRATSGRSRTTTTSRTRFYEWVLGPSMTYTCAVYPTAEPTLEKAQATKHELVAQKLGLQPGMRLLDVGCGWGGDGHARRGRARGRGARA